MKREGHENTTFFVGPEVEHTPAYSKRTLFVVGYQDPNQVEEMARLHKTPHVFLGANHSFDTTHRTDYFDETWNALVTHLLDRGFWVTLDYQAHQHKDVLEILSPGVWQSRLFVPLLGVRIPKIETSSPNLTVKIDDIDFNATNPGVWCMHFHELTDSNRFTGWNDYSTDETVTPVVGAAPNPVLKVAAPVKIEVKDDFTPSGIPITKRLTEVTPVINDASLGLDTESKSQLKADSAEELVAQKIHVETPQAAAEIYADTGSGVPTAPEAKKPSKKK